MDLNDFPDEVKLPIIAALGGSIVAVFNHFSDVFKRSSRKADISVDKIEAEHQLDVGQAELIHRMVDQHLLQENSVFRIMEEEVRENKKTIRKLLEERIAMKAELVALRSENQALKDRIAELERLNHKEQENG
ncbi:MAG: hypothetical protein OXN94_01280 [Chloroflexota bacterium]|nr:hypothetical protein [Chloroflexota bacterium]MDE2856461.1 hypothetical protein [Chloroflexota bacterium]MDE2951777.1 hypothetical protein [Chloroflexota bacterium]